MSVVDAPQSKPRRRWPFFCCGMAAGILLWQVGSLTCFGLSRARRARPAGCFPAWVEMERSLNRLGFNPIETVPDESTFARRTVRRVNYGLGQYPEMGLILPLREDTVIGMYVEIRDWGDAAINAESYPKLMSAVRLVAPGFPCLSEKAWREELAPLHRSGLFAHEKPRTRWVQNGEFAGFQWDAIRSSVDGRTLTTLRLFSVDW